MTNNSCIRLRLFFLASGVMLILLPVVSSSLSAGTAGVVINEVMSNVEGPDSGREGDQNEYLEILNISPSPVDLAGWSFTDGDATDFLELWDSTVHGELKDPDVIVGETRLQAGSYAVILDPEYADKEAGATQPYDFAPGSLVLTVGNTTLGDGLSTRDPLQLMDPEEQVIDTYGTPWEEDDEIPFDPGDGFSVERIDPGVQDSVGNWSCSRMLGGTPGAPNSVGTPFVDIGLYDGPPRIMPVFPTPSDSVVVTVTAFNCGTVEVESWKTLVYMDADGDREYSPQELLFERDRELRLTPGDSTAVEISCGVFPVGIHNLKASAIAVGDVNTENDDTYFSVNSGGVLPGVIINEVLFHPRDDGCEWIEIYNREGIPVSLCGWAFTDSDSTVRFIITDEKVFLPPGGYVVVAKDPVNVEMSYGLEPDDVLSPDGGFPSLNDGGDSVTLYDEHGILLDRVTYGKDMDGGAGISMERIDAEISGLSPDNWGNSNHYLGATPGRENSLNVAGSTGGKGLHLSPNPFSPDNDGHDDRMKITSKTVFRHSWTDLTLFDIDGRIVRRLAVHVETGQECSFLWDGMDDRGRELPPGMYIVCCRIREEATRRTSQSRSMAVLAKTKFTAVQG